MTEHWWEGVEPPVKTLAVALAKRATFNHEDMVLPYQVPILHMPHGIASPVRVVDLVPIWTCYVALAREALAVKDEVAVEAVADLPVTFTDPLTPDQKWKQENGLDAPPDDV